MVIIGLVVIAAMLWFPQIEGRNKNSDAISLYFNDPFLAYLYIGTIPFFFALYQAFKLLGYIERNRTFSQDSVIALQKIKYSALVIIGLMIGAMAWIKIISLTANDDPAGALMIGFIVIFASTVIAVFAAVLQKLFQNALDIKSENDLTV